MNNEDNPYLRKPSTASYGGGDPMRTGNRPQVNNPYLSGGGDPMRTGNFASTPPKPSVYDQAVTESVVRKPKAPGVAQADNPIRNGVENVKRFAGRVVDSFNRTPTMFNAAASKMLGEAPKAYAYRTGENVFSQPARTSVDKFADGVGNLAAQVSDPFAIASTLLTGGLASGAVIGGGFEGAKSMLVDSARGNERDYAKAAGNALGGAIGGGAAARYIPVGVMGNDVAESVARTGTAEMIEGVNPFGNYENPYLKGVERHRRLAEKNRSY